MFNGVVTACVLAAMSAPATHSDRMIVRLVGHKASITIISAAGGVRYSAANARGGAICSNITLEELRSKHPELYRQIDPAICAQADARATIPALMAGSD